MKALLLLILIGGIVGYFYYLSHPSVGTTIATDISSAQSTANAVAQKTAAEVDAGTQASFSGVGLDAQVYYLHNRNYGTSATNSICTAATSSGGLGDIISGMQKLGSAVSCTVDPNFPSKSFTLTVPSVATQGEYYCTDQNGFIGLVPSLTQAPFAVGLKCQ